MSTEAQMFAALRAVYHDPAKFAKHFLGAKLEPWQEETMDAIAKHDWISIKSAHGVGKSSLLSMVVLWYAYTRYPVKIAMTAPSASQLEGALWSELRSWWNKMPPEFKDLFEMTTDKFYLKEDPSGVQVLARTASRERPEALQGIHAKFTMFIVDEASAVDDVIFNAALGSLSTKGAKLLLCSNPTRVSGFFYDSHHSMSHMFWTRTVSAWESSYSREGGLIELAEVKYGRNSDQFRIRCEGLFPLQDEDSLIPRAWVEAALERDVEPYDCNITWGLDVAYRGADRCALARRQGNVLLGGIEWWSGRDTMWTADHVSTLYRNTLPADRPVAIYVDVIGVGAGVVDRLKQLGVPVVGVNVSESALGDRFSRLRDELWWRCREWFERKDVRIEKDKKGTWEELVSELVTPRYTYTQSGAIKIESKEEMRRRGKRSPDIADALVLTMMDLSEERYQLEQFTSYNYDEDYDKYFR